MNFEGYSSLAFAPDGGYLAGGGGNLSEEKVAGRRKAIQLINVWSMASGREVRRMEGQYNEVRSLAFVPGTGRLLSGGTRLAVWDLGTGRGSDHHLRQHEGYRSVGVSGMACWRNICSVAVSSSARSSSRVISSAPTRATTVPFSSARTAKERRRVRLRARLPVGLADALAIERHVETLRRLGEDGHAITVPAHRALEGRVAEQGAAEIEEDRFHERAPGVALRTVQSARPRGLRALDGGS